MKILVIVLYLICPISALASTTEEAAKYFQSGEWMKAIQAYTELVKKDASDAQAWFYLGRALHETGKYAEALDAYREAEKNGFQKISVLLRRARSHSKLTQFAQGVDLVKQAADLGFNQPKLLKEDPEFTSLGAASGFKAVLAQVERNEKPCSFDPEFRQFDFWIGDWDVMYGMNTAGTSHIELILKDCVIVENWSGTLGYNGKSYNVYNPGLKKWQQFWVDDAAGPLLYSGVFKEGAMRFEAESIGKDGSRTMNQMTFFPQGPDQVRQLIEQSTDGGKTWSVSFDGKYVRKKP